MEERRLQKQDLGWDENAKREPWVTGSPTRACCMPEEVSREQVI